MNKNNYNNVPSICVTAGIITLISATVSAIFGTVKAYKEVEKQREYKEEPLTKKEIVKAVWPYYIPTILGTIGGTILIAVGNKIHLEREGQLFTTAAIASEAYNALSKKVRTVLGEEKEKEIRNKISQDIVDDSHGKDIVKANDNGNTLFLETITRQKFYGNIQVVKEKIRRYEEKCLHGEDVSLNDWLSEFDLELSSEGDSRGWGPYSRPIVSMFRATLDPVYFADEDVTGMAVSYETLTQNI